MSRKNNSSKNRKRHILKLDKIYQNIKYVKTDFNQKVSTAIAKHYDTIVVEYLNTQGMTKNHRIAKSILDQGWYQLEKMLEYKLQWMSGEIIKIGMFDPSSKMCSKCCSIKNDLRLSDRIYRCDKCGLVFDRDHNASKNIKKIGLIKVGLVQSDFKPVEIAPLGLY